MANKLISRDFFEDFPISLGDFYRSFTRSNVDFNVDVKESDKAYTVKAELPGVNKDDISLDYKNDVLTISFKREEAKEEKDAEGALVRSERFFGQATRQFYIKDINSDAIDAQYTDGVLVITLPKLVAADLENKKITIK